MEKYSAYRDPGTGLQPFLKPVPQAGENDVFAKALAPLGLILGVVRTLLVLIILVIYILVVNILCVPLKSTGPLYHAITSFFTMLLARLALLIIGFIQIRVDTISRTNKGRRRLSEPWNPLPGDLIVSNWTSWIELLWLAFRFNPTFVVPVPASSPITEEAKAEPISRAPGRRTGTGSANISSARKPSDKIPVLGFHRVSLLTMISYTGHTPPFDEIATEPESLEDIQKTSDGPVVVFPECTTSNGRGLLRFSDVFKRKVPVKAFNVFMMCVRYDPPTTFTPSLSHSIPARFLNPFIHLFTVAAALVPPTFSIRLLAPSESPSSHAFKVSDIFTDAPADPLSETSAVLISQIGKIKRTGMGWEDKASLLNTMWMKGDK
ncbi:hypothetical protein CPB85DRAFT_1229708 [Mucidula mucida]|nr:hypothetical protein CPB85DRAFT_1229708 [Mucidula mucida]